MGAKAATVLARIAVARATAYEHALRVRAALLDNSRP